MKTHWFILLLLTIGSACHADRDIVYAARYYTPPGSHRTSHFHIYRINPDGTGKTQLTFGKADDSNPKWSPNGKYIEFERQYRLGQTKLCCISANGGTVAAFRGPGNSFLSGDDSYQWSPDGKMAAVTHSVYNDNGGGSISLVFVINPQTKEVIRHFAGAYDFLWSPDGKHGYLRFDKFDQILDLTRGRRIAVRATIPQGSAAPGDVVWSDSQTLVGIAGDPQDKQVYLAIFGLDGKERKSILCRRGASTENPSAGTVDPWGRGLLPIPKVGRTVVYVQDIGISGTRPDNAYYLTDILTGEMMSITEGQFLIWSPDGTRFCTAEAHYLADYGKPVNGYQKSLYVAALQIGQKNTDKLKSITHGLSWVTAADWRVGKR